MAKKTPALADLISVKLAVSRSGPGVSQSRGDEIQVSPAEARRLLAAGHIERPDAATVKALAALDAAPETATAAPAAVETRADPAQD